MYKKITLIFFQTFTNNQTIWLQPSNENKKTRVKFSVECCSNVKPRTNKSNCDPCDCSLGSYSFLFIPFSFFLLSIYLSYSSLFLCISSSFSFYFCLFLCLSSTFFLFLSYTIFPLFFSLFCVCVFVIIIIIIVVIIIIIIFFIIMLSFFSVFYTFQFLACHFSLFLYFFLSILFFLVFTFLNSLNYLVLTWHKSLLSLHILPCCFLY